MENGGKGKEEQIHEKSVDGSTTGAGKETNKQE